MALAPANQPLEEDLDIEAILNAMEEASPGHAECIGGNFTLNFARPLHQHSSLCLAIALRRSLPDDLLALQELRLRRGPTWLVPDVVVVPASVLDENPTTVDPSDLTLVVEVLSPSTEAKDRGPKLAFYREHGVDYWIVEPGRPWGKIEVFGFGSGRIEVPSPNLAR